MGWWLQRFDRYWIGEDERFGPPSPAALAAVRDMGTNSLPILLRMLALRDSKLKQAVLGWSAKQSLFSFPFNEPATIRYRAAVAFLALGPDARPAMPRLVDLLNEDDTAGLAAISLSGIGPPAVLPLSKAAHSISDRVRRGAVKGLGLMRPSSASVLATLVQSLHDKNRLVRFEAVYALARTRSEADRVLPALIEATQDQDPLIVRAAIRSLGDFGAKARPAIPVLETLSQSLDPAVSREATTALKEITAVAAVLPSPK